ncbi:hypothetical protein [Gimesia panareensis]|uniref:hypothetical protein n=1 Tax=Gimesia panareensis TaxID=2527978 RepID=UPI00118B10FA|nr:hypothetical protein [Gimesia panareensis]QDU51216.1 hypothetical protein Pan110_35800 [Gimesia panareensis]
MSGIKFYVCILGSIVMFTVYENSSNSFGNTIPDSKAATLFGGADNCTNWDPQSCSGTANGCAMVTKWRAETDGTIENRKEGDNVVCGSQNCGSVLKTKKCSSGG